MFEQYVTSKGFDPETLTDTQRASLEASWRRDQADAERDRGGGGSGVGATGATGGTDSKLTAELDKIVEQRQANERRCQRITKLVGEYSEANPAKLDELAKLGRTAINEGTSVTDAELALLRLCRPTSPEAARPNTAQMSNKLLEAAVAQASGMPNLERYYEAPVLEAAHRQFRGGMSILQLLDVTARNNGYRGTAPVKTNLRETMEFAFRRGADSGVSTISIAGILSNVANKYGRDAFNSVDQTWKMIAARRPVNDFKSITGYALTGDMTYKPLAPGGFIDHGTLGELPYTNRAKTHARMLGMSEEDIVNDDIGALGAVMKKTNRGGALALNNTVWAAFLDNSAFWTSGNGTALTGAGSALALAGLKSAASAFAGLRDPDGELMGVSPAILAVPTALENDAWALMNSDGTNATTTANTPIPTRNPFNGRYKVVSTPYLQDSRLTGYSAAAWYLLASPDDVPVIEVVFLHGVEMPTVETTEADFNQLGIQVRGKFAFGAAKQEYRGGVRSAGS